MRGNAKAQVVKTIVITRHSFYEPYDGLDTAFRVVIAAAHEELEAHPDALVRQESSDPKPTLKVTGGRNNKSVTMTFVTREMV